MSLDKAIAAGKERRKPYRKSKRWDRTCRNHGSCSYCVDNRIHSTRKAKAKAIGPRNRKEGLMYYPKLGITIPDAVMVTGNIVSCVFNPNVENRIAAFAEPWYRDEKGRTIEGAFHAMYISEEEGLVTMPVGWVDYVLIPPMRRRPLKGPRGPRKPPKPPEGPVDA